MALIDVVDSKIDTRQGKETVCLKCQGEFASILCKLEWDLHHSRQDLYQQGLSNQKDRIALEASQATLSQTRCALTRCEASQIQCMEELHNERLEHRARQEELCFEKDRHKDTERVLESTYQVSQRMSAIVEELYFDCEGEAMQGMRLHYADLMLEIETRKRAAERFITLCRDKDDRITRLSEELRIANVRGQSCRGEHRSQSESEAAERSTKRRKVNHSRIWET